MATEEFSGFRTIRWTVEEQIGQLMMDQPPSNIMTLQFFTEFRHWTDFVSKETGLKAIIIHGNGRHFSSGADISELLGSIDEQIMVDNYRSFTRLEQTGIPVISSIRGVCLGSAFELALFSHFRICGDDAVLGLPESTYNLMPGIGGIQRVANLAGKSKALEIILRGTTFSASDALEMGLVDTVVPKRDTFQAALRFARALPEQMMKDCRSLYLTRYLKTLNAS